MKRLRFLLLLIAISATAFGQSENAIMLGADTMQKHIPGDLHDKVHVKAIIMVGNKLTRDRIILREMNVASGDTLYTDSLARYMNQNKLRIMNLALFNEVEMEIERINNDEVAWYIKVKERWYIFPEVSLKLADRNFNVWWYEMDHDIKRALFGLALTHNNFRGNHEKLSVSAQVGYTQKFGINYQRPFIDKKQKHGIGISIYDARSREMSYRTDSNKLEFARSDREDVLHVFETNLTYTYRPAYVTRHLFQLSYRDYTIADTVRDLNPTYYKNGSTKAQYIEALYRIDINKVDNWNYPLNGFKLVGTLTNRFGLKGLGFQSFINVETGFFHNPFGKWYWDVILRGRLMLPERPPYAFLGGMGSGSEYIRGYEYYVIDGPQYGLLRFDLKNEVLNYTIKGIPIRFLSAIPIRLYPKIFADIGAVRNPNPLNSRLNNRFLYSGGIGLDIVTFYEIKLRIEYAINHLGEKGLFLHSNAE